MGIVLTFPSNVELDMLTQEYVINREQLLGQSIMPFQEHQTQRVRWDELDSVRGMTAVHNMDSDPRIGRRPGSRTREYEPIPFKETDVIKESELLRARELGTLGGVINIDALVVRTLRSRVDQTFLRAEYLRWQALCGALSINENGVRVNETFPIQTYTAVTQWSDHQNATPLRDFNAVSLLFRGTGASAAGATAYLNRKTLNDLLENTNESDIRGFRNQNYLDLTFSLDEVNRIMAARGLPNLVAYDEGYIDDDGNFRTFIPDNVVIVVGRRPNGERIGEFAMTPTLHRQVNGLPAPGFFTFIEVNGQVNQGVANIDLAQLGAGKNPKIEITGGVYGGPILFYPRSIVRMNV